MKIRADFVTNSSSSGFVCICVKSKKFGEIKVETCYDTGWGGYVCGFDKYQKALDAVQDGTGEDVLNAIMDSFSDPGYLEHSSNYLDFKSQLKEIETTDDILEIRWEEENYAEENPNDITITEYTYQFPKNIKVPFVSAGQYTPSFKNRVAPLGDFSIGNENENYQKVSDKLEEQGWFFARLIVNWLRYERTGFHGLFGDDITDFDIVLIGDKTAEEIEAGQISAEVRKVLQYQGRYKYILMKESDLFSLGRCPYPCEECAIDSLENKAVCLCGRFDVKNPGQYVFERGGTSFSNWEKSDYVVIGGQSCVDVSDFAKKQKNGPKFLLEDFFVKATSSFPNVMENQELKPLFCKGKRFAITGLTKENRAKVVETLESQGAVIESGSVSKNKMVDYVVYGQYNRTVMKINIFRHDGAKVQFLTPEQFFKSLELADGCEEPIITEEPEQPQEAVSGVLGGKVCCLTGDFAFGQKSAVEEFIVARGGTCTSSVTKKTNMLIIGDKGSASYAHGNYGSKYIKAKQMQDDGADMTILKELDFFKQYTGEVSVAETTTTLAPEPENAKKLESEIVQESVTAKKPESEIVQESVIAKKSGSEIVQESVTAKKPVATSAVKSPEKPSSSKPVAKVSKPSSNYSFPTMDVPDNRKKILTRKPKKNDKPNRYDLYFRPTFETDKFAAKNAPIFYYYCDKVNPGFSDRQKELLAFADTLTTYFGSIGDELREKAIRHGYMKSAYDMHALRSYVWTSLEWCKTNKKDLDDIGLDGMQALCDFIAKRSGTNYDVIAKGRKRVGTPLLVKSEYGITYYSVLTSKIGLLFIRTDEEVKKETHGSSTGDLNELIKLLLELRPHVEAMAEYLKGVDRAAMTDGDKAMESVLAAYCTFALAADEPFDVLKGPEALDEAVLDEPLTVPEKAETTILDGKAIMAGTLMIGYLGSGTNLLLPEGIEDILVMDLDVPETNAYHKAETITYPKSLTAKSIKIPYNVKNAVFNHDAEGFSADSEEKNYDDHGKLNTLIFKGTIQNLGGCWLYADNLMHVDLPNGLKRFKRYAFDGARNLAEITFPETVESYDEEAFDRSNYGSKPLKITAYAGTPSEKLAKELASKSKNITCNIVVSPQEQARRAALEAQKREEQRRLAEEQRKLVEEQRRLAEEQRRVLEEQNRLAAEKRAAEINAAIMKLRQERVVQEKIVAENGGLFGEKARKRKAAKEQIASIDAQIAQLERSK